MVSFTKQFILHAIGQSNNVKNKHFHKLLQFTNLLNAYNNVAGWMALPSIASQKPTFVGRMYTQRLYRYKRLDVDTLNNYPTKSDKTLSMYSYLCRCLFLFQQKCRAFTK